MRFASATVALCLSPLIVAKDLSPSNTNEYCMYAIYKSLSPLTWKESTNTSSLARSISASECSNEAEVTSIYLSVAEYCHGKAYDAGLAFWDRWCVHSGTSLTGLDKIEADVTTAYIERLSTINPDIVGKTTIVSPVLLDKSYYLRAVRSVAASQSDNTRSINIAWGIHGYWGLVILVGIIQNFIASISYAQAAGQAQDPEKSQLRPWRQFAPRQMSRIISSIHTYVVLSPSLGNYHRRLLWGCKVPLRIQTLTILAFWALAIILSCLRYDAYSDDPFNGTLAYQIWKYMGPRLGFLAFACLPWLWIFAGRNNIFIWATGWDFQTFNLFHRHLARVSIIFAIIHSISYTVKYLAYSPSKYYKNLGTDWFRLGIVATVLMSLMIPFSSVALRKRYYEVFLIIHIVFGIVIIYALFVHMSKFGTEYTPHLWPLVAIWSFDRLLRIIRLTLCNLRVHCSGKVVCANQSTVTYHPGSNVLRIEIRPSSLPIPPKAGDVYYIYQPGAICAWENHPFTMASFQTPAGAKANGSPPSPALPGLEAEKEAYDNTTAGPLALPCNQNQSIPAAPTLTFWVRPYSGWTKRLKDRCLQASGISYPTLLVEGPYGRRESLHSFTSVVMIMGGTGIGVATAYLQDLLSREAVGGDLYRQIDLHWTVRELTLIGDLCRAELGEFLDHSRVRMHFYCSTGTRHSLAGQEGSLTVENGRAPIQSIIARAAAQADEVLGEVAVLVCGPAGMADDSRAAVVQQRRNGCRRIEYFEEAYGW
ncbi:ferric reductase like transmembrane component-domain-containing protein [Aspergillus bertholletiae]|uniref:Ferric reductase like transmembrane component-domain-containing protein n=1 Tax=Aspergillus bertholletiae TaxID=1226010 RepID=A0A5N7AWW6_9EURO|nr:ferric reductase like transmembrane component-domain-containing protein [Aspergillus bertholletiae]